MDVETPNVSVTTNDERSPLITPRARVTKPAAWVWAIVMVTCLAGVIFLGVSGNDNDMGVSGNLNDAAAEHVAGDSSSFLGRRHRWRRKASRAVSRVVHHVVQFDWEGTANKFEKAMNDAKADATNKAQEIVKPKREITELTGVINAVKNMHKLSELKDNAIIPPDIKNAVSTVVDSIDGVKRDVVSLFKEIGTTVDLVADAVVGSTLLIDAITKAPDKLFTASLDKVIPTNAYNLVTMLKVPDLNAASAGGAAVLGASAPAILHPDNTQALRPFDS